MGREREQICRGDSPLFRTSRVTKGVENPHKTKAIQTTLAMTEGRANIAVLRNGTGS